jgi:hypothetical protein
MNFLLEKSSDVTIKRTEAFMRVFLRNYDMLAPRPSLLFKRRTLIALGSAMLLQSGFYAADLNDKTIRRAADSGLGCLRAAGDSEEEIDTTWLDETLTEYEALFAKVIEMCSAR